MRRWALWCSWQPRHFITTVISPLIRLSIKGSFMEILIKKQQRHIRLRNVIVFTEAIFGEKELVFGSVVGGGGRGAEGRQSCHSVCCSSVCFSTSVYGAFKSLQMCRGLRPTSPPQKPWASCQRRLTVKINSTDTASESYTGGCRRKKVADSRLGLWNNYFLHYVVFLSDW